MLVVEPSVLYVFGAEWWGGVGWGGREERAYNDARREMTSLTIFVLCVLLLLQTIYTALSVPLWHFVYQLFLHLAFSVLN